MKDAPRILLAIVLAPFVYAAAFIIGYGSDIFTRAWVKIAPTVNPEPKVRK